MPADEYGFDPDQNYTAEDNPFWDGTDAAHPAWWRGNDRGVDAVIDIAWKVLSGELKPPFTFGSKDLSELCDELHRMTERDVG